MASRTCTFKQQDVTRALRAADRAGVDVQRVEIDKEGKIVMVTDKPLERSCNVGGEHNEWDAVK